MRPHLTYLILTLLLMIANAQWVFYQLVLVSLVDSVGADDTYRFFLSMRTSLVAFE